MSDLPTIMHAVSAALEAARFAAGNYADDPRAYHERHRAAMGILSADLTKRVGARISQRGDAVHFRLAGIAASSTSGVAGALSNWLQAAQKRVGGEDGQ